MHSALMISSTMYHNERLTYIMGLRMLITVVLEMSLQIILITECLTAHITAVWTLPSMYTLMYLHFRLASKCFVTHITAIGTLPSMYSSMYLKVSFDSECFITHITTIWTLHSTYNLLSFHSALLRKTSIRSSLLKKKKMELYYQLQKM